MCSGSDTPFLITGEVGPHLDDFLTLIAFAAEPYHAFVYDSLEQAAQADRLLFSAAVAEFSPPAVRLLLAGTQVAGAAAALPGSLLRQRRLASALTLARTKTAGQTLHAGLRRRIRLANQVLLRVPDDEYYVSRIAVAKPFRRRGAGRALLTELLHEAQHFGYKRCLLEVNPRNEAALALYERCGFERLVVKEVIDPQTGRSLQYAHMACCLATIGEHRKGTS